MSTFILPGSVNITPIVVNLLTWTYTPQTVVHEVLNPGEGRESPTTSTGPAVRSGSLSAVFDNAADADAIAVGCSSGFQYEDPSHFLNGTVMLATQPATVTQDASGAQVWVVAFDWVDQS